MKILDFGGGVGVSFDTSTIAVSTPNYTKKGMASNLRRRTASECGAVWTMWPSCTTSLSPLRYSNTSRIPRGLDTMQRILKPGGLLLFTTGNLARHRGEIATWFYARHPEVHISFFTRTPLASRRSARSAPSAVRFAAGALQYLVIMRLPYLKHLAYWTRAWWRPATAVLENRLGFSKLARPSAWRHVDVMNVGATALVNVRLDPAKEPTHRLRAITPSAQRRLANSVTVGIGISLIFAPATAGHSRRSTGKARPVVSQSN